MSRQTSFPGVDGMSVCSQAWPQDVLGWPETGVCCCWPWCWACGLPLGCLGGMRRTWSWPQRASDASLSGSLTGYSYWPLAPIRWSPSSCWTEGWRGHQRIHISWTACLGGLGSRCQTTSGWVRSLGGHRSCDAEACYVGRHWCGEWSCGWLAFP